MQQRGFGDLEATVMDRVWGREDGVTVREVFEELCDARQIAYTTVLSTLDNLHRKGWVRREREGKAYRYWATMTREQRSANLMRAAFQTGGRPEAVLAFFVEQMSDEESAQLKAALRSSATQKRRR
ncbi:BlaI/MecI/CopY family transcriptional regulator [Mycolicibacterium diernhoferi]|uniref:CopY family transcriptional regulator n=1 Tax=Mycolicibacterium diernhoferi TaxID=1801 RepID=A0A1Q4HGF3_9MYCO|nr:BlaI/MecI/CopY family transcriptional regulator [Mycolicibacterium diernhoferi]OJZ66512.1 CopY family transcriptional regulator [Mycolicibacterium diernhoferi]OPE53843.1 CopY family transcriptional regulator [Mycolicibacterium diernhoferi]PEG56390.1 CopY family transcriptional regulator [Mycolicibacterium diernhoferi]QYL24695.1 BlaI/MecI/CopY family transcriptional regulator [Mycolicibacterium diernhoferi]